MSTTRRARTGYEDPMGSGTLIPRHNMVLERLRLLQRTRDAELLLDNMQDLAVDMPLSVAEAAEMRHPGNWHHGYRTDTGIPVSSLQMMALQKVQEQNMDRIAMLDRAAVAVGQRKLRGTYGPLMVAQATSAFPQFGGLPVDIQARILNEAAGAPIYARNHHRVYQM